MPQFLKLDGVGSPDDAARGLTDAQGPIGSLRYTGGDLFDPYESPHMVSSLVDAGARVLDVGCSSGEVSEYVRQVRGAQIVGVEPDGSRAAVATSRGLEVHHGLVTEKLISSLGEFDAVLLVDVLEHLAEPAEMLRLIHGGLKREGSLIISTPNVAHWVIRLNLLRGRFDYTERGPMDATHLRWFTRGSLRRLISECGYRIEREDVSAGTWLAPYQHCKPWRWIPPRRRRRFIRRLANWRPELFGCQFILKARRI